MGEVTGEPDLRELLRQDNPGARAIEIEVYVDALRIYWEAAENVRANGAICSHPRTGAPIENPYLKVQTATGAMLAKMRAIKSDRVMAILRERAEAEAS